MALGGNSRRLKLLSDLSLIEWLIGVSRDRFDPKVTTKPSRQMVEDTILEILVRMQVNSITCPECQQPVRNRNYCCECGNPLK